MNTQSILLVAGISFFFLFSFIGYVSSYGVSTCSTVCFRQGKTIFRSFSSSYFWQFQLSVSGAKNDLFFFFLSILFVYILGPTRVLPTGR